MSVLTCENLCVRYDAGLIIKDLSFSLEKGDYLCVTGENGSGKSTLMKSLLGLLKPQSGKIALNGIDRREMGYLPQQSSSVRDFPANVYEVVLSGCLNRLKTPFYTKRDKERAREAMRLTKTEKIEKRPFGELSGGQVKRVLLARALCASEKFLALDEPAAGLDSAGEAEMYGLIGEQNRERGVTVVMISHDVKTAARYANKILCLGGAGASFKTAEEYGKNAEV
ncbi:MAG: metal ABC transporter ATP-binding protein [Oscillospiraceae bacterium]|jgi:zinc transport system ATP-binding protein|nr:metal ABC transporter ATP-binding protein [Oscillospiraceae bacterium]